MNKQGQCGEYWKRVEVGKGVVSTGQGQCVGVNKGSVVNIAQGQCGER